MNRRTGGHHGASGRACGVFVSTLLAACAAGEGSWQQTVAQPPVASEPVADDAGQPSVPAEDAGDTPLAGVTIVNAEPPPRVARLPRLSFSAPKANEAIPVDKADGYLVRIDVKDWFVSPGDHLHLVLDNEPYKPIEDPAGAIKLGDVVPSKPLAEGHHVLAVFAARADHSTVKPHDIEGDAGLGGGAPVAVVPFWIGKAGKTAPVRVSDPMLLYSRPKGTYNGADADGVLLDFYLVNAPLGEGRFAVDVSVVPPRGEPVRTRTTRWEPLRIDGLPSGIARVRLELIGAKGEPVRGPFGVVERDISVNRQAR